MTVRKIRFVWGFGLDFYFRVSVICLTVLRGFLSVNCVLFCCRCVFGVSIALIDCLNVCFGLR
jgi:hypothetical protein